MRDKTACSAWSKRGRAARENPAAPGVASWCDEAVLSRLRADFRPTMQVVVSANNTRAPIAKIKIVWRRRIRIAELLDHP